MNGIYKLNRNKQDTLSLLGWLGPETRLYRAPRGAGGGYGRGRSDSLSML